MSRMASSLLALPSARCIGPREGTGPAHGRPPAAPPTIALLPQVREDEKATIYPSRTARSLYYWARTEDVILLLLVYGKVQQDDLTPEQRAALKQLIQEKHR